MDKVYISRKFRCLSVAAALSVIIIHSKALSGHPAEWNVFIQWFFTRAITKWSVPFFFLTSGYWFYETFVKNGDLISFYRRKFSALFVPYVLWAVVGAALTLPLIVFNNFVTHRGLMQRTFLESGFGLEALNQLFGVTVHAPIGNAVLWYVHTLLFFFLLAPLWKIVIRKMPIWLSFAFGLIAILLPDFLLPICAVHTSGLAWAFMGMLLAKAELAGRRMNSKLMLMLAGFAWVSCSVVEALCEAGWMDLNTTARGVNFRLIPPCGIIFFWLLYDCLPHGHELPKWFNWTFWIYCLHAIVNSYFMSAMFYFLGKSDFILLGTMIVTPAVGLSTCIILAHIVQLLVPSAWRVLTGGRG